MRHLITVALLVGAVIVYALAQGPLFFGAPVVGGLLLLCAAVLELSFWHRLRRKRSAEKAAASSGP